ncbi:MAG: DNA polymerase III subunit delta' [Beijerinckiaceae bacterium]|nr:DNA polymerase III subunit delta' [Beijerinckiaceae bacterium]
MKPPREIESPPESDRFMDAPHPRLTQELFGHQEAQSTLLEAYRSKRLPHAWIIGGLEGVGKATLAWRFARFVLAYPDPSSPEVQSATDLSVPASHPAARRIAALSHGDLLLARREWDSKTKRHFTEIRAPEIRRIIELFRHSAGEGGWRVVILDCVDDLNRFGANALLKMIEEPPSKSLFLLISHRPAHILPTIRSRSRMLHLMPLAAPDIVRAMRRGGEPWSSASDQDLAAAAERGQGSVRSAMRLLEGKGLVLSRRLEGLLARLPDVDWSAVHDLADTLGGREAADDFETTLATVFDWLDTRVRAAAPGHPSRLAPLAEVWEKIAASARETEAFNLDRRPLILSMFSDLAAAARAARP